MFKNFKRNRKARSVALSVESITIYLNIPTGNEETMDKADKFYDVTLTNYEKLNNIGKTRTDFVLTYFETFKVLHDRLIGQLSKRINQEEEMQINGLLDYLSDEAERFFQQNLTGNPLRREYEIVQELLARREQRGFDEKKQEDLNEY